MDGVVVGGEVMGSCEWLGAKVLCLSQISPHKGQCNQFTRQISLHKV